MTPGRPAASSPASLDRAAWPSRVARSSPLAWSRIVASGASSGSPPVTRARARRMAASLTTSFSPWPMLEALISCTLRQLVPGFEPIAVATTAVDRSEIPVVAHGHAGAAARRPARAIAGAAAGARRRGGPGAAVHADEPGGPVPVPLERLEERQHLLVA